MNFKGTLPLLILHYLTQEPTHGYRLNKLVKQDSNGVFDFKEGSLYVVLSRLEEDGFVTRQSKEQNGRLAVYYSITDLGKEAYKDGLAEWKLYAQTMTAMLTNNQE